MSRSTGPYLLLGPEAGEKEAFLRRLLERLSKEHGSPPEVQRYYPFEGDLTEALANLANGSLFAGHRVLLLNNAEALTRKRELDLLAGYCAHPAPGSTLVMLSDEVARVDRRLDELVPKENKVIFWELFESQKQGWIVNYFKTRGIQVESPAVEFLLDMVDNDTRTLAGTCEKLALFFGSGSRIGYAEVEKILFHSKEENVYTLFERLAQRDFAGSLEVLAQILLAREADAVQLLAGLAAQYRKVLGMKRLLEASYSVEDAAQRLKIRGGKRVLRIYAEGCRRYGLSELESILYLTARFDLRARSLKSTLHGLLLELYLYYAALRGGWGPWVTAL
jgi:DNA polymerase-3 subunit delta